MAAHTKLSGMPTEELLAERQRLQTLFFAPKAFAVNMAIVTLTIGMARYAIMDGISYTLTALVIAVVYSVVRRFRYRRQPDAELAARR